MQLRCLFNGAPPNAAAALALVGAFAALVACTAIVPPPSPELELVTASDGVSELHVRTKRPYRIIFHKTNAQGAPTTTTILLNGASGSPSDH